MPVAPVGIGPELGTAIQVGERTRVATPGFADHLVEFLHDANAEMQHAEKVSCAFAAGETNNIHETILAAERADIVFKLVGTMRNRLLDAYNEVMRMGV